MIVLASNSQLRKMIMEASGIPFEVMTRDVDERHIERQNDSKEPHEIVQMLAEAKAGAVAADNPERIVIAADTFGVLPDGTRLHKGRDIEESIQMALAQSGKTVRVYTGLAVRYGDRVFTSLTTTHITYSLFDEATVRHLFNINDNTRRHAALGFFVDAPGFTLVKNVEGSYLGAMGLPMEVVRTNLTELEYIPNLT